MTHQAQQGIRPEIGFKYFQHLSADGVKLRVVGRCGHLFNRRGIGAISATALLCPLGSLLTQRLTHGDGAEYVREIVTIHGVAKVASFRPLPETDEGALQGVLGVGHGSPSPPERLFGKTEESRSKTAPKMFDGL